MINQFDDVQKIGRESVNRTMQSLGALTRGWQVMASETAGFSKQTLEDGAAYMEKLLGVKSLEVAAETQAAFVKSAYERAVGQAARIGELYVDLAKDVAKPFEDLLHPAAK